ncbi:MAG: hypothetical protein E2P04_06235 [Acidobacteria bacterium]|nr:MAG: hypothetical protein E2P04_06235 [Acidobacteriota bacterium]
MKKTGFVLWVLVALMLGPSALAAEHHFGLRVGNTNFDDPNVDPTLPAGLELKLRYRAPGCTGVEELDSNGQILCAAGPRVGGFMKDTGDLLNDAIHIDEIIEGRRTLLDFRRSFEAEEFDGNFIGIFYEFRRDADSRFSLSLDAGVFSTDATHVVPGNAHVDDPNISNEDPGDYDDDGNTEAEDIPVNITDRMEYSLYFAHITARYNWTPGKFRLWVGGGVGLWANLWREIVEAEYVNLACIPSSEPGCNPKTEFRESQGDRRTILPLSVSVGATWQFLPHWAVNLESRLLFLADSNVTLFESESDYDIGGNQVMLGFSYKL